MPVGRYAGKRRVDFEEKRAELALMSIEFGGKVTDVGTLDLFRLQLGGFKGRSHRFAHDFGEMLAFSVPVAGEITLRSAEDIDRRLIHLRASTRSA